MATALILGTPEREALAILRGLANDNPVDIRQLMNTIKQPEVKAAHKRQMNKQTVELPTNFLVTFSIEHGHGVGTCRHMSMSVGKEGRVPHPAAVWMVAEVLGFVGGLEQCMHWLEDLEGHGEAVNVLQPVKVVDESKEVH